jgi:isoquinoline 1-oxidoreductase subunit beta
MIDIASVRLVQDTQPSRRSFLIGATAVGSSLIVGFAAHAEGAPDTVKSATNPFAGYVEIAPDETVTVQAVWKRLSSPQKLQRMGVVHVDVTV